MIITRKKTLDDIINSLKKAGARSIHLFGCDSCAEQCQTGGKKELEEMKEVLGKEGFKISGTSLVDETCYNQLIRREFRQSSELKDADTILVLACGAGVKTVADNAGEARPVLPALDSVFLASVERVGRFFEGCSLCGSCVLDRTGGICPHTDCPKGMLNGPCGGVDKGKCEVNRDNRCAWIRIYERLKSQGRLEAMTEYTPPKDHSASTQPRSVLLR